MESDDPDQETGKVTFRNTREYTDPAEDNPDHEAGEERNQALKRARKCEAQEEYVDRKTRITNKWHLYSPLEHKPLKVTRQMHAGMLKLEPEMPGSAMLSKEQRTGAVRAIRK